LGLRADPLEAGFEDREDAEPRLDDPEEGREDDPEDDPEEMEPEPVLAALRLSPALFAAGSAEAGAGFASSDLAGLVSSDLGEDSSRSAPARLRLFSLSDLKSVSYHPPPFKRKTGAETSFFSAFFPQEGHFSSGGSEIFCMTSV
jgi:hypothetical protein